MREMMTTMDAGMIEVGGANVGVAAVEPKVVVDGQVPALLDGWCTCLGFALSARRASLAISEIMCAARTGEHLELLELFYLDPLLPRERNEDGLDMYSLDMYARTSHQKFF